MILLFRFSVGAASQKFRVMRDVKGGFEVSFFSAF